VSMVITGDWGLNNGDWGLGREATTAEEASSPVIASRPSPQSPVPAVFT